MSARPAFRQADITRAVKAATAAGLVVSGFEVDQAGKIVILTGRRADEAGARDAGLVVADRIAQMGAARGKR
jgi:hypothetical protein